MVSFLLARISFAAILTLATLSLSLSAAHLRANVIEQIIVAIDGEPYTFSDLRDFVTAKTRRELSPEDFSRLGDETKAILEGFITGKLVSAEAKRLGIQITEEQIDRYIETVRGKNHLSSDQLEAALHREGTTMEQYRASVRNQIERGELINREVEKKVNITSEDIERYYNAKQSRFVTRDRFHLRHILIMIPRGSRAPQERAAVQKIKAIRKRAANGEDFAGLARTYSEGPNASEGGDIGWVDRNSLLEKIANGAAGLSPGEVSPPIRTHLGVHLIRLQGREKEQPLPLPQVQKQIRKELYSQALEERFQKWLKTDLRKRHRVDVKLPGFVFQAEDTTQDTVKTLMASASSKSRDQERSFLSYLNPLTYIMSETPVDEEDPFNDHKIVSLFGVPLFVSDSPEDIDLQGEPLFGPEETGQGEPSAEGAEESQGFFSSVMGSLNPF